MVSGVKPKFIFGKLMLLGILAVGMILGCVFWLTARINQLERDSAEDIVHVMVGEKIGQVDASVKDYAHWNLAYEVVTANDEDAIYDNIGSGADDDGLFHHISILDADGRVLHSYNSNLMGEIVGSLDPAVLTPFLERLKAIKPESRDSVSGISRINSAYGAISMTRFTPDYYPNIDISSLPIMVGIRLFTDDVLTTMADMTRGSDYAIVPIEGIIRDPSVNLSGPDGVPVAQLVWQPRDLGTVLRKEIMPGIIVVCLGIFGICLSAARYFRLQSRQLEQAMRTASTDDLTGLLNRSGLYETLQKPEISAKVSAGELAVVYVDLNDFKKLNDQHGHKNGDIALKATAERLRSSVRSNDLVVRLGGDEFICVVFDRNPAVAAKSVSDRLLVACNMQIEFGAFKMYLTPSVGVAVAEPGLAWEVLLGRADQAMYEAKRKKQSTAVFDDRSPVRSAEVPKSDSLPDSSVAA